MKSPETDSLWIFGDAGEEAQVGEATMQRWRKTLGWAIGILWSLGGLAGSASAQYTPQNFGPAPGEYGGPPASGFGGPPSEPGPKKSGESPLSIRDDGTPNAFTDLIEPRSRVLEPYTFVFRGEYLNWHLSSGPTNVPLVTTTNFAPVVDASSNAINYQQISGVRLSAGVAIGYLPPIEVSGFYLQRTATVFSGGSLTNPTQFLAIPFQDDGIQSSVVIANPGVLGGTINITSKLTFWNVEANMLFRLIDADALKVDAIVGYRHLELNEDLEINTQSGGQLGPTTFNATVFPQGLFTAITNDGFTTNNQFNGGQIGLRNVLSMGRWALFSDLKLGLGETIQRLDVGGSSSLNQLGSGRASQGLPGGILGLPTNSGSISTSAFSVVPEANIALSFQVNRSLRMFAGYNFLAWTNVTRPGDALPNAIDARQIPTSPLYTPGIAYNGPGTSAISNRTFIAEGFFVGLEFGF